MDLQYMLDTFLLTLQGIPNTLIITFGSIFIAAPIAFSFSLIRFYNVPVVSQIIKIYISMLRATPLILLIMIFYSFLPSFLNVMFNKLNWNIDIFEIEPIFLAMLVFVIVVTGSLTEVFRSALLTVDKGQLEAGVATGLTVFQTFRRIIIPQAIVSAIPPLCNLVITVIKGTSLVFVMTVKDVTAIAKVQAAFGYRYTESYVVIFIMYIILCSIIQIIFKNIEDRIIWRKREHPLGGKKVSKLVERKIADAKSTKFI